MMLLAIYATSAVVWLLAAPTACWINYERVPPLSFFLLVAAMPIVNTLAALGAMVFLPFVACGGRDRI